MIHSQIGLLNGIKPIALDGEIGYFVRRDRLIMMWLADLKPICSIKLPLPKFTSYLSHSQLLTRVLRLGVQCGVVWRDMVILAVEGRLISARKTGNQLVDPKTEAFIKKGHSPLNLTVINNIDGFNDGVYYGEYFSNPSYGPVAIMHRDSKGQWIQVFEFPLGEINHIHNLIPDPLRGCIWILTGDYEGGAAIWKAKNNFSTVEVVARGAQDFRACVAFPVTEGLLYATDSQIQENNINLLEIKDSRWTNRKICSINGPVIYGMKIGKLFVFSTATEPNQSNASYFSRLLDRSPGRGISRNESQIIVGSLELGFSTELIRAKDPLPYRLFQFGNIFFPSGNSSDNRLYMYSIANCGPAMSTEVFQLKT
jgi:hypothetical protein